jgi:hypothetical protein
MGGSTYDEANALAWDVSKEDVKEPQESIGTSST